MLAGNIDDLMQYWAHSLSPDPDPPFINSNDLYNTIDSVEMGHVQWQSFALSYQAEEGKNVDDTPWKLKKFDVWYCDPYEVLKIQLSNHDLVHEMDLMAKRIFDPKTKQQHYQDFMSGEWAWEQSDILAQDNQNHGVIFCPVILGSDKMTVSVATGQNDYYLLYMSNRLIHNSVHQAHQNGVSLIAFLAIPKTDHKHDDSKEFRQFHRKFFHVSLSHILETLREGMASAVVMHYADGYYQRMIYGLGLYIVDYPEQVLLACVVQDWCPKCTAPNNGLDGNVKGWHTHKLMEALTEALDEKALWFDYGIVSSIMYEGFPTKFYNLQLS
ncbi:hypothetical protein APHAL10511_000628 [Amanita phalloides]|nr:hypothetical protein APHAL10511_000628 [Amanita phalloides]